MIDHVLIAHGMRHPDLWMMWAAIILSVLNTTAIIWRYKR